MQSIKSLAVVSDPDATRQRPMTELEGLLHRALCEMRDPVETAAEVINFCDGLLRRRKRLEKSVCQKALARLEWLNLNDANPEEAESVRELQRILASLRRFRSRRRSRPKSRLRPRSRQSRRRRRPMSRQRRRPMSRPKSRLRPRRRRRPMSRPRSRSRSRRGEKPAEAQEETEAHGPVEEPGWRRRRRSRWRGGGGGGRGGGRASDTRPTGALHAVQGAVYRASRG